MYTIVLCRYYNGYLINSSLFFFTFAACFVFKASKRIFSDINLENLKRICTNQCPKVQLTDIKMQVKLRKADTIDAISDSKVQGKSKEKQCYHFV